MNRTNKVGTTAAAALLIMTTLGAQASTVTSITIDASESPTSWATQWGPVTVGGEKLQASGAWSYQGENGDRYHFLLDLTNFSDSGSRIVSWGFDTNPFATGFQIDDPVTGWETTSTGEGNGNGNGNGNNKAVNITNGIRVDHCAWSGSNCSGGQNGGLTAADGTTQFKFSFATFDSEVTLSNFIIRLQDVGSTNEDSIALSAIEASVIPLPAAGWLLLGGLGALGALGHRRRRSAA